MKAYLQEKWQHHQTSRKSKKLRRAIEDGNGQEVSRLLAKYPAAIINTPDEDGNTALHSACEKAHSWAKIPLVPLLIQHGATSTPNHAGKTPLQRIQLPLLARNHAPDDAAAIISTLLPTPARDSINHLDPHDGMTMLHRACRYGNLADITRLIEAGADAYTVNKAGDTPLEYFISKQRFTHSPQQRAAVITALLPAEPASVNQLQHGKSPFHYACRYGNSPDILRHLKAGANPALPDDNGTTPMDSIRANMTLADANKPVLYKIIHDRIAEQARRSPASLAEGSPAASHQERLATRSRAENSAAAQRF